MENDYRKKILLIITNGFAATNVIHSGLIRPLAEEYDVYICSDLLTENEIHDLNQNWRTDLKWLDIKIPSEIPTFKLLRRLEKAIFFKYFRIITQTIREKSNPGIFKYIMRGTLSLAGFLHLNKWLLKFLRKQIISQTPDSELVQKLRSGNFNGIISTSPLDIRENMIVNAIKGQVRSMAMVISWDNLTTKGLINADHDYVLVWNKFMEDEYLHFYKIFNLKKQSVRITGIPRFDIYFQPASVLPDNDPFRYTYKAAPGDKIILFATSANKHFPTQANIVHHLIQYTETTKGVKLIVRCHPADDPQLYSGLTMHPNVSFWFADSSSSKTKVFKPRLDALISLAEMLKRTDVCVNVASTIRLDAAACNKSIISIAYDGNKVMPYAHSVARFYDYTHQLELNNLGIDKMVFSKQELFDALNNFLFQPAFAPTDKIALVKKFTHFSKPVAIPTIMKLIAEWLQ